MSTPKRPLEILAITISLTLASVGWAQSKAYKVGPDTVTMEQLAKDNQGQFFELEKQRYDLIERIAREKYLDYYWNQQAKKQKKSVAQVRKEYFEKNAKVSDSELKETLKRFKDHPRLKDLSAKEKEKQVREYLRGKAEQDVREGIITAGIGRGELQILYPRPKEPVFQLAIRSDDPVKYGPKATDTTPKGCKGDACAITIVEYSEFECPFCKRVLPAMARILNDYQGQIRMIARDFPLSFHKRAKPAAVAARCAGDQGKFWQMYETLFDNQRSLGDADFEKYAKKISLNEAEFKKCVKNPSKHLQVIEANIQSGQKVGVTGTPAYFINGRRLSGALPYEEFKRVVDEELANAKKS